MRTANLDIDQLRSFAAVADCGSFTAAGELVARTQSAVSVQIKRLEEILGATVFERSSRSLALTRAGETLLVYARRILELNDESVRRISEPPVIGSIRLGITEYFVPAELPLVLSRFTAAYPEVHVEVRMGLSRELREGIAAGTLDAAIVRLAPSERAKALWSEAQVWVAKEGAEPTGDGVVPLVLLPAPCVLRAHALESMKRRRRRFRVVFTGSSMASIQAAVRAGLGVSIMPASSLLPGMRVLPREYPDPGRLNVGVVRGPSAKKEIIDALQGVMAQILQVAKHRAPSASRAVGGGLAT
jgi:DNA-binding transcriptional LysR family regulator